MQNLIQKTTTTATTTSWKQIKFTLVGNYYLGFDHTIDFHPGQHYLLNILECLVWPAVVVEAVEGLMQPVKVLPITYMLDRSRKRVEKLSPKYL